MIVVTESQDKRKVTRKDHTNTGREKRIYYEYKLLGGGGQGQIKLVI